ncbi:uncharacterized protein A4U43_C01F35790 [Asparagus officinalis]|uniref:RRM domain-containing protein n=1 Tax=Asparagus officinalis TaxID=4686 RepID=A0A5P1FUZ9_ASPOF|nr:uncharacterized protein A4U43_C01F35790 [Asparagus officinalis]
MPKDARISEHDGASPGKIFIGGLPRDLSSSAFVRHFEKYGTIIDHVIMKDRHTQQPRGFGFITFEDPSVVDTVIEDTHVFNGKTVEIKRTIPKGAAQTKDFKTKKIFVGGIPTTVEEDELKSFFSKFGKVVEHEIIRDHSTKRSRGFGFIIFDSEQAVDDMLAKGNMIDFAGSQVEVKKAEPKKSSNPPPPFASEPRGRSFGGGLAGYSNSYNSFGGGEFGPSYRTPGGLGPRIGEYGSYGSGAGEFGGGYSGGLGDYRGESSLAYSRRFSSYGGYGAGGYGGTGSSYGAGAGYDTGSSYGGPSFGSGSALFGGRGGGYGGGGAGPSGRYHPYAR